MRVAVDQGGGGAPSEPCVIVRVMSARRVAACHYVIRDELAAVCGPQGLTRIQASRYGGGAALWRRPVRPAEVRVVEAAWLLESVAQRPVHANVSCPDDGNAAE